MNPMGALINISDIFGVYPGNGKMAGHVEDMTADISDSADAGLKKRRKRNASDDAVALVAPKKV